MALAVVAAHGNGSSGSFGQPNSYGPRDVIYIDYEMTRADLRARLDEFGYPDPDEIPHLHYWSLPSLPPLDTPLGCAVARYLAAETGSKVFVIDTMGRAVEGDENSNDTYRAFARHTGLGLKSDGVAVLRTDHAGKDKDKGQRGASAKNDDADVVFRVDRVEGGWKLTSHSHSGGLGAGVGGYRPDRQDQSPRGWRDRDGAGDRTGDRAEADTANRCRVLRRRAGTARDQGRADHDSGSTAGDGQGDQPEGVEGKQDDVGRSRAASSSASFARLRLALANRPHLRPIPSPDRPGDGNVEAGLLGLIATYQRVKPSNLGHSVILDFDPARRTNAQAIADLATLGILLPNDHVLDTTVGHEQAALERLATEPVDDQ